MKQGRKLWLKASVALAILALVLVSSLVPLTVVSAESGASSVTVSWASIAPMPKPRHAGATVVVDGIIYTIGGAETDGVYRYHPAGSPEGYVQEIPIDTTGIRVEAYDPASNTWTVKADLPYPPNLDTNEVEGRMYLAAAAYEGKIYTFGGSDVNGVVKDTVDVYDIATDTWTAGIATLPQPTAGMSAVTYGDKIYLFGGSASTEAFAPEYYYGDVYEFNPATATFTAKSEMSPPRTRTSAVVFEDEIMVFGGSSALGNRNAQMYDPVTDSWSFREVVVWERGYWFGTAANGMVFLMGGRNEEQATCTEVNVYSEEWQAWVTATNMPSACEDAFVAAVDGELYVMGGSDNKGNPEATATSLNTAVRGTVPSAPPTLDLTETPEEVEVTIQWTEVAPMPTPRCYGAMAVVDNIIYTIGGLENKPITARVVEAYDPVTNKWTTKALLPEGRFNMPAAAYDGKIYIFGGVDTELKVVDTVDVYDIATNTWTAGIATLPKPAAGIAAVTAGDMIYLFGGSRNPMMFVPSSYYFSDVYEFDPQTLTFTPGTPMPVSRNMSFVGIVEEGICVIGGVESMGATSNNVYSVVLDLMDRAETAKNSGDWEEYDRCMAQLKELEKLWPVEAASTGAKWEKKAEMPEKRGGHSGAVVRDPLENCDVHVIGGHAENSVLAYDSETDEWQNATPMEIGRNICYVGVAEASPESMYVIGGMDSKGNILGSVEKGTPYEGEPPSEPEPSTPPSGPETTPPPSGTETTPSGGGMGCGASSMVGESFDFSPILLGVVWVGAAIVLGSRRKRSK